jgi:ABC-type glycerol-3-phosphate transport system permease component
MKAHGTKAAEGLVKVVLSVLYLVPLAWIIINSLKSDSDVLTQPNAMIFVPSLQAYGVVLLGGLGAILTSLEIAVLVTGVILVVAVPAVYALASHVSPRWNRVVTILVTALLVLQLVPQPMTVIPLYSVLAAWGLLGSIPGLILADTALFLPFAIMLLRPFARSIPSAIYEAAEIDGASRWQVFVGITVPMLRNGMFIVFSFVFIGAWGEFVYAINFLTQGTAWPVSGILAQQISIYSVGWNRLMALAVITCLPLLIVFLFVQKRLVSGLSLGAVK